MAYLKKIHTEQGTIEFIPSSSTFRINEYCYNYDGENNLLKVMAVIGYEGLIDIHNFIYKRTEYGVKEIFEFVPGHTENVLQGKNLENVKETLENGGILITHLDMSADRICELIQLFTDTETNPHNAQLLFTTYNVAFMDRDSIRPDMIWIYDKNEKDTSQFYSFVDFEDLNRPECSGLDKWFEAGRFCQKPKTKLKDIIFKS